MMQKSDNLIRKAVTYDARGLAEIEKRCFSVPWSEASLYETVSEKTSSFFVADDNGELAGYIGAYFVLDEGYITNIAVLPEYRRRGIAEKLIRSLIAEAEAREASFLTLEVRAGNAPAIKLYEKLGFGRVGVRRGFYTEPCEDAQLMTLFLRKDRIE